MHTWLFTKVKVEDNCLKFDLKDVKHKPIYNFSTPIKNLELLLKHYKINLASQISGKSFISSQDDAIIALEILLIELKTEKKYRSPSSKKIFDTCARSLANMKEPDLSLFDSNSIYKAFAGIWTQEYYRPNSDWLAEFNAQVQKLSKKTVKIENTKVPKKYLPGVLGPYCYLDLVSIYGRRITFIIGPYSTPIEFATIKLPNQK